MNLQASKFLDNIIIVPSYRIITEEKTQPCPVYSEMVIVGFVSIDQPRSETIDDDVELSALCIKSRWFMGIILPL